MTGDTQKQLQVS